eukprot:TRINITY_DN106543_c0_g1_i1.p1 TRINITY_DN106543_c0_g1~~TRINITY_DN106543_c0_g1_i1.p1  ORF type:complete len:204 (-),score=44.85 TRINITY_DN106543_c0_g1_i1:12-623(-)
MLINTNKSTMSAFTTLEYEELSKIQKDEAKVLVKEFVKTMVKGQRLSMVRAGSGEIVPCLVSLGKRIDRLTICDGDQQRRTREIPLFEVKDVIPGNFTTTGKDDVSVTITIGAQEVITFILPNTEDRENFANGLALLTKQAKANKKASDGTNALIPPGSPKSVPTIYSSPAMEVSNFFQPDPADAPIVSSQMAQAVLSAPKAH